MLCLLVQILYKVDDAILVQLVHHHHHHQQHISVLTHIKLSFCYLLTGTNLSCLILSFKKKALIIKYISESSSIFLFLSFSYFFFLLVQEINAQASCIRLWWLPWIQCKWTWWEVPSCKPGHEAFIVKRWCRAEKTVDDCGAYHDLHYTDACIHCSFSGETCKSATLLYTSILHILGHSDEDINCYF